MASGKNKRKQPGSKNKPRKSRLSRRPPGNRYSDHGYGYVGNTAPEEPHAGPGELTGLPAALAGYSGDDQIPVVITTDPDAPKPANAGAYIGEANTTLTMVNAETGEEYPAPPGSRLYVRTSGPEPGIDKTVRVGDLTAMEKIPAQVITSVPEDDTTGMQPGDVIATRQPVGYTDRDGSPVIYADTGIALPPTGPRGRIPPGSRVWRAGHVPPGAVIAGEDVRFPALRQEDAPAQEGVTPRGQPRFRRGPAAMTSAAIPPGYAGAANAVMAGDRDYPMTPELSDAVIRQLEARSPGLAARLARGMSPAELEQAGPEVARAVEEAGPEVARAMEAASGASSGAFSLLFNKGEGDRPEIVITDDLDSVPGDGDEFVIEDLDPADPDAGRIRLGSRAQVEAARRAERAADERARKLIPGLRDPSAIPRSYDAATAVRVRKTWTADEVLDMHAWLTRAYRNPADPLADYLAAHIRQALRDDYNTEQLFWPVDVRQGADIPQGRQMAQLIARGLDDSRTFQVTAPMVHQLRDDWISRGTGQLVLDEGVLPVPAGFAWLDSPWLAEKPGEGFWLPVRAVSWERTVVTVTSRYGQPFAPPGLSQADSVRVVVWLLIADDVAFGRWAGEEKRSAKVASKVGQLVPQMIAVLPFGIATSTRGGATSSGRELIGLLHTLWTKIGEKLPKSRPVRPAAPAVRARVQRSIKHGTVHIIPLREYDYIGEPNGHHPQARDWRGRWWVDEFYRHIDYYDDGTDEKGRRRRHAAVPALRNGTVADDDHDICAVCHANGQTVRITLVRTFAKGPTNKPFITPGARKRTVYKLKR
jgi:hypothetical protein